MSIYVCISKRSGGAYYYALAFGSDVIYSRRCETLKERKTAVHELESLLRKWR